MRTDESLPSSFRDPSGFLFHRGGRLYRQVNASYRADYKLLMESGLYQDLTTQGLLVPHVETSEPHMSGGGSLVIEPEVIPFISYAYEWCFSQLQDAALATLAVQKQAVERGMSLKDASAYNIQFRGCRPVMIDTLSFERYCEGEPWVAYRQFCQHFLAPLALMSHADVRLGQLLRVNIDGIPLDLASHLLPSKTRLNLGLGTHIHLHAQTQRKYADKQAKPDGRKMSRMAYLGLIDNLESTTRKLSWKPEGTEWADYYAATNYTADSLEHKTRLVGEYLQKAQPKTVWDLGANTGRFSRIAAERGIPTIAFDIDPAAVELNYLDCRKRDEKSMLPLFSDVTNPSPAIGWQNRERQSLIERGPCDTAMALALIHHLAIGNNLPLDRIVDFTAGICRTLIIEFVPKTDSQVQRLLATREDIFPNYTREAFERAFSARFALLASSPVRDSERNIYLMELRQPRQ
ncbi:SAM-dependent methyltransferase [candidate division WOR-3 bacterium]|uniref:SAM-dependent methyltransferase n=1 Tax=candidate division WOR-3 bacterium TaxID=2052148 RepID=A0A937XHE4_UNCW3|nr:SAM-dependent methyltransferase [candidate division WOR-3 bacterium]